MIPSDITRFQRRRGDPPSAATMVFAWLISTLTASLITVFCVIAGRFWDAYDDGSFFRELEAFKSDLSHTGLWMLIGVTVYWLPAALWILLSAAIAALRGRHAVVTTVVIGVAVSLFFMTLFELDLIWGYWGTLALAALIGGISTYAGIRLGLQLDGITASGETMP